MNLKTCQTALIAALRLLCLWMIGCVLSPAQAASPPEVDAAVNKGTAFLLASEKNGNWEQFPAPNPAPGQEATVAGGQWGGMTALATYGLLCAGVPSSDLHLLQAVHFLTVNEPRGTYAAAARCMVWARIPLDKDTRLAARRDFQFLVGCMRRTGEAKGAFDYGPQPASPGNPIYDQSASQFAVLGIWSLVQCGFELNTSDWQLMDTAWRAHQFPDGSWPYYNQPSVGWDNHTVSMTAAGVATLFIIDSTLDPRANCNGNPVDKNIVKGMSWLGDNFQSVFQPIRAEYHVEPYSLFGVSRIGASSGYKYLGKVDWFAASSDYLKSNQQPDGSWSTNYLDPTVGTSFGLMCLSYGRAPVVFNKLQYGLASKKNEVDAHWNQRPQDCLNFVNWFGKALETRLNWQIVNLASPMMDLQSAPILFISGNEVLNFTPPEKAAMKLFVEQGGMILGNADCNAAGFSTSFTKLAAELFPTWEMRELPANHPIFTAEQYAARRWKNPIRVMGVSNGLRELMLLPKEDLGQNFQRQANVTAKDQYQLASDIVLYAVDKDGLRTKGDTYIVTPDANVPVTTHATVARLEYTGNWDPEPGGWRRLAAVLQNQCKVGLTIEPVKLGVGGLKSQQLAHLTGTAAFKLTDAQRQEIKQFIASGGTLCIDAAGGSAAFATSTEAELATMFGDAAGKALQSPLPLDHPLFKQPDAAISKINYRTFAKASALGSLKTPRICGIEQGGRIAVFYSREDLSGGLVGEPVDGIIGYDPATATALMRNIVLYAFHAPAKR